jgi:hypothetical protein
MRLVRITIAALAVLAAIPATASAARVQSTITIRNAATPADAAPVTFNLTGPTCARQPIGAFTFTLKGGESKTVAACNADPTPITSRYKLVETVPVGFKLTDITCDNDDADPRDALILDVPKATALIEVSPFNEFKSCTFHNTGPVAAAAPPPAPVAQQAPAAAAPVPTAPTPTNAVEAEQQSSPSRVARIAAATVCTSRVARVTVTGRSIRSVTLFVNGKRVKTLAVKAGARTLRTSVPIATGSRAQIVTATVRFRNGARARTITAHAKRCAATQVQPTFTG